jgi:putative ABC transport system permease protein
MFFVTYLRRELRRRMRQAVFTALGLALGVGLVVTVAAVSAGVKKAESKELSALYGAGTDVTVTGASPGPPKPDAAPPAGAQTIRESPGRQPEMCTSGKCTSVAGKTIDNMLATDSGISQSKVAEVARLRGVTAAAGGISLTDSSISFSSSGAPNLSGSNGYTVQGVDTGKTSPGPLSIASLASGHSFTAADADADVAVVDSGYAKSKNIKAGSELTIDGVKFTVIGIVRQAQASSPPDVYVPLKVAQGLTLQIGSLKGDVNEIYVVASSAANVSSVSHELSVLLPGATVTDQASLASEITGSVTSAAKLANDLGRWLAIMVLIAAFAVASLLTMAAVARRVREFGTLKAIGWRSRRIVSQVLGESAVVGFVGAVAGIGLGFAGAAIISAVAPKLSAVTGGSNDAQTSGGPGGAANGQPVQVGGPATQAHTVAVALHPSVTVGVIILAVVLAVAGGLLAGSLGSWRIAKLRPADALARVA